MKRFFLTEERTWVVYCNLYNPSMTLDFLFRRDNKLKYNQFDELGEDI